MVTIYIHQKPFIICDAQQATGKRQLPEQQLILLRDPSPEIIPEVLSTFADESIHGYIWESANPDKVFQMVAAHFEHWEAAGGLVTNKTGDILLMFRRGHWDLPKGKLDPGETIAECALREVKEETALSNITIEKKLTETWHVYPLENKNILKQTHWYQMAFTGSELTVPQIEEDITDIQWIKPENIHRYLKYAYPNIAKVFTAAGIVK